MNIDIPVMFLFFDYIFFLSFHFNSCGIGALNIQLNFFGVVQGSDLHNFTHVWLTQVLLYKSVIYYASCELSIIISLILTNYS